MAAASLEMAAAEGRSRGPDSGRRALALDWGQSFKRGVISELELSSGFPEAKLSSISMRIGFRPAKLLVCKGEES